MNIHRITYNPKQNSASLYFIGCNFRCLWCYHKELYGKVNLKRLKFLNLKEALKILKSVSPKRVYILSGDPCKNCEFSILPKILYEEFGAEVRLLTNAYILPCLEGLKHVSISIKVMDEELHKKYTGRSNKRVISNFKFLYDKGIELSSSCVFIPGCVDKEQVIEIAQFIASIDKNIPFRIIGYIPVKGLSFRKPSFEEVGALADEVKKYLKHVSFSRPEGEDYTGIIDLFTNNLERR